MAYLATYNDVHFYPVADHAIELEVEMFPPNGVNFQVKATLDSGAAISYFDRALLPQLGISNIVSPEVMKLQSASDDTPRDAYVHLIKIRILGRNMTIPIAFCPSWDEGTSNLLGMRGFFDQWRFGVHHAQGRLYYSVV